MSHSDTEKNTSIKRSH